MDDDRKLLLDRLVHPTTEAAASTEHRPLTTEQRRTIANTFRSLLEGLYAHLPQ